MTVASGSLTAASGNVGLNALQLTNGVRASSQGEVQLAARYYLADQGSGRGGWAYPRFRVGELREDALVELSTSLDEATHKAFKLEAERQDVWAEQLLEHALLYLIADLDSGRVTQRILDDPEFSEH